MKKMADPNFYVIYLDRDPGMSVDDVNKVIDRALNWFRLSPKVWVVYTTSDAEKWYGRLKHLVKDEGNVFICKLDISERQGWMSREFWSWFQEMEHQYNEQKA
jgi:hypothetical protein